MLIPFNIDNIDTYNSYTSVEEADDYFSTQYGSKWEKISNLENEKSKLLISASRLIDIERISGISTFPSQTMLFPINTDEFIPKNIKLATCEIAMLIYVNNGIHFNKLPSKITLQGAISVESSEKTYNTIVRSFLSSYIKDITIERG